MTGAGPGLEKLKMPGPGLEFFYCRGRAGILIFIAGAWPRLKIFIAGAYVGLRSELFFYCRGLGLDLSFFIAGPRSGWD